VREINPNACSLLQFLKLILGSEAWTIKKRDKTQTAACKTRQAAGYTKWDLKWNEDVMKELDIEPMFDYIQHYQKQWKNHLQ
jgi:hypothetical protein